MYTFESSVNREKDSIVAVKKGRSREQIRYFENNLEAGSLYNSAQQIVGSLLFIFMISVSQQ